MAKPSAFVGTAIYKTAVLEGDMLSRPWVKEFQQAAAQLISPVTANVPATSVSVGVFGQIATDGTWLYVAVGTNSWKRIALAAF